MDPYQILGVSRDATEDEIKKAYRSLSRKYHPDSNINNPNRELIEEKFKQVQQAYQLIMKEKQGHGSNYGDYSYGGFGDFGSFSRSRGEQYESQDDIYFQAAENYIRSRSYKEAFNVLNSISQKNARWYYLSAIANAGSGNNVTAMEHAKNAVNMEPGNIQYQRLLQQLEGGGEWYRDMGGAYGDVFSMDSSMCSRMCFSLMLCNICFPGVCCCGPSRYN